MLTVKSAFWNPEIKGRNFHLSPVYLHFLPMRSSTLLLLPPLWLLLLLSLRSHFTYIRTQVLYPSSMGTGLGIPDPPKISVPAWDCESIRMRGLSIYLDFLFSDMKTIIILLYISHWQVKLINFLLLFIHAVGSVSLENPDSQPIRIRYRMFKGSSMFL